MTPAPIQRHPTRVGVVSPCPHRELLADLTHDLKNPLAIIKGTAQLLDRRLGRPEPIVPAAVHDGLAQIEAASTTMALLLDDLLDAISFGREPRPTVVPAPLDLVQLTRQVVARYQSTTERHAVRVEATGDRVVGFWDAGRLERVLANLLSNALKFSPDGGEVVVAIRVDGRWAELGVRDHGLGIPAAEVGRVFDPGYRATNAVGHVAGTGLGLAGVRRIVEEYGGTVVVTTLEGVGTTVAVRLPVDMGGSTV